MTIDRTADPAHFLFERYRDDRPSPLLHAYYRLRPLMPRPGQIALRRAYSHRQRRRTFPAWPIEDILVEREYEELRRQLPAHGNRGVPLVSFWPGGHRFAFVLTHDVESTRGIANIARLREVEERRGLVSCWNFCAEDYPIPDGLFDELRRAGCEIGLHGLDHRGRLFESRAAFEASLPRIRQYLREWDVAGFRSPALHRDADWIRELGCAYDSSFPDTDPYEPQPGGCCSIFPFLNGDVVELPITLAQDHTLFEILRHRDIRVWRQKTEWLVRNHGLVNVIVHPDYIDSADVLERYQELLDLLTAQSGGWHALPREVADWWRSRNGLRCELDSGRARIDGPGAERATVIYARQDGNRTVIEP